MRGDPRHDRTWGPLLCPGVVSDTTPISNVVSDTMSPRKGPRRPQLAVRLSAAGIAWIDARAAEDEVKRSELVRRMLAFAVQRMPKGWKP